MAAGTSGAAGRSGQHPRAAPSAERAPIEAGARLLPLEAGFYTFTLRPSELGESRTAVMALPRVHVCGAPAAAGLDITGLSGRTEPWVAPWQPLFVTAPPGGTLALLTAYGNPGDVAPVEIEVRRLDRGVTAGDMPLVLGLPAADTPGAPGFEVVTAVRGAGELRFVDTLWAGRLGRGRWIEAFTLTLRSGSVAGAVEYKGLTADGAETAWLGAGLPCGTVGGTAPLIGFAVRQRPGSSQPLFDCEYGGCFQSGATAGPVRNGAPCLSPTADDPLEGLQIRLIPRGARAVS